MTLCVRVSACLLLAPTAPDSTVTLRRSTEITSDIAPRFFSAYVESYVKCLHVPHQNARHWPFFILKIPRYNYDPTYRVSWDPGSIAVFSLLQAIVWVYVYLG